MVLLPKALSFTIKTKTVVKTISMKMTIERKERNSYPNRRDFLGSIAIIAAVNPNPIPCFAEEINSVVLTGEPLEMKTFLDPKGLFAITVPTQFYTIRRMAKGDLPDEKTGIGRRGSSIFNAGNLLKSQIIAVERYPIEVLLRDAGITPSGDLTTFKSIGDSTTIAKLISNRRDRDKNAQSLTTLVPGSVKTSDDGKTIYFQLRQKIDMQKPELYKEQTGLDELIRFTVVKATLTSNDGQLLGVFASALLQDYDGTTDGPAIRESVNSFVALDQSKLI